MNNQSLKSKSKFTRKCEMNLKKMNAPTENWICSYIYDFTNNGEGVRNASGRLLTCDLCKCPHVRFVHVLWHPEYKRLLNVGGICASVLEGDDMYPKAIEKKIRNRARRKEYFAKKRKWSLRSSVMSVNFRGKRVSIKPVGDYYVVYCGDDVVITYCGDLITDIITAAYAAYDLVDPLGAYYE